MHEVLWAVLGAGALAVARELTKATVAALFRRLVPAGRRRGWRWEVGNWELTLSVRRRTP